MFDSGVNLVHLFVTSYKNLPKDYLISSVWGCLGSDCAIVGQCGVVNDQLTLALTQILNLNSAIRNYKLSVDEELHGGGRILDLQWSVKK